MRKGAVQSIGSSLREEGGRDEVGVGSFREGNVPLSRQEITLTEF